ncbi:peptidyl-prolyl cis-trans isomerase [Desulfurobacterium thermolithotrophum]|uniref:peptidylprolyl isomerase n=1 Tax=Desulfurobacterium thermolithotrophum TaxID=64160 RepID=UPI0013D3FAE6|nr:peptidylprolyl isomerase [Desulfurobacterium thermolithotrophum]
MKRLLTAATVIFLISSCSHSNHSDNVSNKEEKVCTSETPLAKVDGKTITVAYYKGIEDTIPEWVINRYYSGEEGKENLLKKIIDRQLILLSAQDEGIFEKPDVKKRIESFKIRQLAYRYLNSQVGEVKVSDEEVKKAIEKYYKGKKVTPELENAVRINLEAQKFQSKRNEILKNIENKIEFKEKKNYKPNDIVATYNGITIYYKDVEPIIPKNIPKERLKEAVTYYVLSKLAQKEGIDKKTDFQLTYNRLLEDLAVKDFEKKILSKVKVTDKEIKDYYEKHKSELKTPERADIEVFEFSDENKAKKALLDIEKGKSPKEVIPKNVYSTGKEWKVTSADIDRNPVSALVFKEKNKNVNVLVMPDGRALLIVVKKRYPAGTLPYGDAYSQIKRMLTSEKARKLAEKEIEKLKEKYGVKIFKENLKCVE